MRHWMAFFLGVGAICGASSCASSPPPTGTTARAERRDDRRDRRVENRSDWTKLGERWVDGKVDRDAIEVGGSEGRFRRIMLVVEHSAVEMFDVNVVFGDGSSFSPPTRLVFGEGTTSREVDLPGGDRAIRRVEFRYGNLPGGGRAQVELWAR